MAEGVSGVFREMPDDPHFTRRQQVLRRLPWYPSPDGAEPEAATGDDISKVYALLKVGLDTYGTATIRMDRLFTNGEFIALAGLLGVPQEQADERLAPWVEDAVVLNLRADHRETPDREWMLLFAENYVMLHTELAGRMVSSQVRHLMFQCVVAPAVDHGGQTLLVPMPDVRGGLTDRQADILSATRHAGYSCPPTFLSRFEGRDVFAFKDVEDEEVPWRYDGADATVFAPEVNGAIRALLAAMYDPAHARGLPWEPLLLGAFDNTRFFHGRTWSPHQPGHLPRHLREIRVFRT